MLSVGLVILSVFLSITLINILNICSISQSILIKLYFINDKFISWLCSYKNTKQIVVFTFVRDGIKMF